ncbi:MAG: D-alanyl-D-alanine carboxypeptidase/D-alanyl-D-alanine-endopeptidase [Isosphaeraceae bacterium]|jgi:D-alanyl-D-alanine carboxypeptidase/D-alanyl-D-alanine-endopeptidase (penicillin-binding protein 4)|nr:MAG: D-alanyl-D-alanine carboxypeptidase/D-alanyl-D-alanine-endopeptidase [Isosphaeraceae bacterium]
MRLAWWLPLLLVVIAPARGQTADGLAARIEAVTDAGPVRHGHWGLLVVDAKTGETLYERNADRLFRPASVTKLFSTAAALVTLGADHRFETPVVRRGEVDANGILRGDLILVAQGDPSLGGRTGPDGSLLFEDSDHSYSGPRSRTTLVPADPLAGLDHLAREVAAAGIKAVAGEVLIDDRLFDPAPSSGSGPRRVTPIVINDNLIDVVVTPAEVPGQPATVRLHPATAFVSMDAQVRTVDSDGPRRIEVIADGPRRFRVRGTIPVGVGPAVQIYEVEEPADFARAVFIETLRRRGIEVESSPLGLNDRAKLPPREAVASLPRVAVYTSPPFSQYVRVILKVSQNLHASMLPLLLAVREGERTLAAGLAAEGRALKSLGIDLGTISFGGGAGGSGADLVTPRATVSLLRTMSSRPEFSVYRAALPILGRDGTLARAVDPDSPARGHVWAKTGTYYVEDGLTGKTVLTSKALAGYMETASGRELVFAFFVNNLPLEGTEDGDASEATAAIGRVLGRLCEAVYVDAGPPAAERPAGGQ